MSELKRHCGNCSLCCKIMGVPEVKKDHEWCPHARPQNKYGACTIYETICPACPDVHLGDAGPLDHWTRYKTVRFYPNQSGGVA